MTAHAGVGPVLAAAPVMSRGRRTVKRSMDLVLASILLVLALPVLLLAALAVRLTSSGPVLFRQERVGYLGSTFVMFKFRSMLVGNDDQEHRAYVSRMLTEDAPPTVGPRGIYKPDHSCRADRGRPVPATHQPGRAAAAAQRDARRHVPGRPPAGTRLRGEAVRLACTVGGRWYPPG